MGAVRRARVALCACVVLAVAGTLAAPGGASAAPTIDEFPIPTAASSPQDIVQGPDGNLWFTENATNKIGRVTPGNPPTITDFQDANMAGGPFGITVGPDGNIWYTEQGGNDIGRMPPGNPAGVLEFNVGGALNGPRGITAGPDGNLWVVSAGNEDIVRVNTAGAQVGAAIDVTGYNPRFITTGPDGNMWVTGFGGKIGRIPSTGGTATTFNSSPAWDIASGPDGNLYYSAPNSQMGRITPSGSISEFPTPTAASDPFGVVQGPDCAMWFAEAVGNKIGRLAPGNPPTITEFGGLTANSRPEYIASGPSNTLWFTEKDGNRIGRITGIDVPGLCPASVPTGGPADAAPEILAARLTRRRIFVGRRATSVRGNSSQRRRRRRKTGTTIRYRLSEAATMRLRIERIRRGRRVGRRCVRPRRRLRNRRRCNRYRHAGTLVRESRPGLNRVRFTGRVGRRALKAGRYRLVMRAIDAGGKRSRVKRLRFRVVKAKRSRARGRRR